MNLSDQLAKDAGAEVLPTQDELAQLQVMANKQLALQDSLKAAELHVAELKEVLHEVRDIDIPTFMDGVGIKKFTLTSGYEINIKEDVRASMRADKLIEAVAWLDEQQLGGIVKDEIKVNFGRDEIDQARALMQHCMDEDLQVVEKLSVHPQTLKATVKEQLSKGIEFPEEFFSIFPDRKAVIKLKK